MRFDSYIVSDTKTAFSVPIERELLPKKSLKQKAFTLAETLITLSIIGVVAAITVPTLMSGAQKQTYVTGLKKAYNQLQHAMQMIPINENCPSGDYECAGTFTEIQDGKFNNKLMQSLATALKAKRYTEKDFYYGLCHTEGYDAECYITEDGMIFAPYWSDGLFVDVNGPKGNSVRGRDVFVFAFATENKNGIKQGMILPSGSKQYATYHNQPYWYWRNCPHASKGITGQACDDELTGRVIETGKMDY
ncbi:type II secretion system protein [bacterium]|nr:type II secretion system protein [bacterium]